MDWISLLWIGASGLFGLAWGLNHLLKALMGPPVHEQLPALIAPARFTSPFLNAIFIGSGLLALTVFMYLCF
ncbi:MAG: hypothetical protein OHK0039_45260 [Bacteroidia bacterium]